MMFVIPRLRSFLFSLESLSVFSTVPHPWPELHHLLWCLHDTSAHLPNDEPGLTCVISRTREVPVVPKSQF